MKIRNYFVANSSSSSFIVIKPGLIQKIEYYDDTLIIDGSKGKTEFGWEDECSNDVFSKINFSYLQCFYMMRYDYASTVEKGKQWLAMLEEVIKNNFGCKEIVWNIGPDKEYNETGYGYIDHQSCSSDGENTEMFASMDSLTTFIFSSNSYIQTDNDNH